MYAMRGRYTPYIPGWDNHGMPIESAIIKEQKLNRKKMSVAEFRTACHNYAQKYIDIQMPLLGVEKIGWKPGCELQEESTPYNEQKDIAFYIDRPTAYTKIYPGQFAVYFPEDGHAPGIGQGNIRKVIVKVQVEE